MDQVDCGGLRISAMTTDELFRSVQSSISEGRELTISYAHFHTANLIRADAHTKQLFGKLDVLMADGNAMLHTLNFLGYAVRPECLWPSDVRLPHLFGKFAQSGWPVYLLGGPPGVADRVADILRSQISDLRIAGVHHGFLARDEDSQEVVDEIRQSGAKIVVLGMGQPNQESWMIRNHPNLPGTILIGVGGYFDHLAQGIETYVGWIYRWKLNWAYRLWQEPARLWRRYTLGGLLFALWVSRLKIGRLLKSR